MRLPLIAPADLTPEQKALYDDMRKGIASMHEPGIGKAIWDLTLAMTACPTAAGPSPTPDLQ